jgi:tRNA-specific 2-thiouridylase
MFNEYEDELQTQMCCVIEIKFDVFMKIALSLGADYVATGHYCRKSQTEVNGSTVYQLRAGNNKTNLIFFANYHKNNYQNLYFP